MTSSHALCATQRRFVPAASATPQGTKPARSPSWLEFLYEVGEIAARGGDLRQHIVGARDDLGQAA
jgi:hypothetical protein